MAVEKQGQICQPPHCKWRLKVPENVWQAAISVMSEGEPLNPLIGLQQLPFLYSESLKPCH